MQRFDQIYPRFYSALTVCLFVSTSGLSQSRVVDYKEVNSKFEQFQDGAGFLWQANKDGALTSGETQYLPSGMKLFLNGEAYLPESGKLTEDDKAGVLDLNLSGKVGAFTIERSFWFDVERGGVRVLDTIRNGGGTAKVKVELKTAFQFPWQNLVGTSGRILPGGSKVTLGDRDQGIMAKFSVADGRQDTIILLRGDSAAVTPQISASSNSRELTVTYDLSIPGGKTQSLVHWVARRNISNLEDISKVTLPFYQRRSLINSRVPGTMAKSVVNFPQSAFPNESGPPANLSQLVVLNELIAEQGLRRGNRDTLQVSANNQLVGRIDSKSTVQLGTESYPIAKIAAIEGGGSIGRVPRVFMRDGTVHAGPIELKDFALKVGDEWAVNQWQADQLNVLLLAYNQSDGVHPSKAQCFLELRSGRVLAVASVSPDLSLVSVWGRRNVALADIDEMQYLSIPRPEYRLQHSDGSSLSFLPSKTELKFTLANGTVEEVSPRAIRRIWRKGLLPFQPDLFEARWGEIADVPNGLMPNQGFLLQGNNLFAGTFTDGESIKIVDEESALDVAPGEIKSLRKLNPSFRSTLPQFEIELLNGDLIKGGISQAMLRMGNEKESWSVPVRHLIGYQREGDDQ